MKQYTIYSKSVCGIQTHEGSPFKAHLPDPLLSVSHNNPGLVDFIKQCMCKTVCDSVRHDSKSVSRMSMLNSEYSIHHDHETHIKVAVSRDKCKVVQVVSVSSNTESNDYSKLITNECIICWFLGSI